LLDGIILITIVGGVAGISPVLALVLVAAMIVFYVDRHRREKRARLPG
jgi:hypothetical protein